MKLVRPGVALVVVLCLAGCTKTAVPRVVPTPPATVASGHATTTQVVIADFKAAGLTVGTYNEFLAGHDPNPPLGIAGVYAGATWHDGTLQRPAGDTAFGFEDGGTVEVFATQADREARQKAFASMPANGGTVVGRGVYLMLLSPLLAPDLVARYTQALPSA
jgi:hypothetical protein